MAIVYGLFDPDVCEIRYVGKTIYDEEKRLMVHVSDAILFKTKFPVHKWIRKLLKEDNYPDIYVLEEDLSEEQSLESEMLWIARLKAEGYRLLNATDGGDGVSGYRHTEATKEKLSQNNHRRGFSGPHSDETRKKLSEIQLGSIRPQTSGENHWTKRQGRGPNTGRKQDETWRANNAATKRGKRYPDRNGKHVECVNDGLVFRSQVLAAQHYGLTKVQVSRSCRLGQEWDGLRFRFVGT